MLVICSGDLHVFRMAIVSAPCAINVAGLAGVGARNIHLEYCYGAWALPNVAAKQWLLPLRVAYGMHSAGERQWNLAADSKHHSAGGHANGSIRRPSDPFVRRPLPLRTRRTGSRRRISFMTKNASPQNHVEVAGSESDAIGFAAVVVVVVAFAAVLRKAGFPWRRRPPQKKHFFGGREVWRAGRRARYYDDPLPEGPRWAPTTSIKRPAGPRTFSSATAHAAEPPMPSRIQSPACRQ
ncbi:protein farnesyltransferase, putative [Trypanosoma cruzi marinkellei]|uniref:Protein farnesyltransferase, putative n=1 Tax=Trypanosoma cruzi marinkellei TaxID=85056 RepID=K2MT25_TRYCR|nr:protein farnesyltransferase, putative [Trypanosoma cruzi marinkellei]